MAYIEKVITGGSKYPSEEKLRSLVLLDKCLVSSHKSTEFVTYVQQKLIVKTLKPLATHCPQGFNASNLLNLNQRGANVFLKDEPDTLHAAQFLTLLLCCLKTWAQRFPRDENSQPSLFQQTVQ